jgi:hypothetical protein
MRYREGADGGRGCFEHTGRPVNAQVINQPSLIFDADPRRTASGSVRVYAPDPELMASLGRYIQAGGVLQSILRVTVLRTGAPIGDNLPDVFGRYEVLEDGIRFIPYFPFERGLSYRASFDPRSLNRSEFSDVLTLEFSLPKDKSAVPTEVKHIFPSSDYLPENLLRLYVCFSNSMQRGRVRAEISLLGPDGEPAPDVLYRAPVELWDRSMQYLTILLDPGRLKRGVGPNRELGPPLKAGQVYTLAVGAGMTDLSGNQLPETIYKRFRVTEAVREPIALEQWKIVPPVTNSRQPLVLMFPRPLDWALLSHTITIVSTSEQSIDGRILVDQCERRWSFTPTLPWTAGSYHVRIASSLEDVCGNNVIAPFDRPLRSGSGDLASEVVKRPISFHLV